MNKSFWQFTFVCALFVSAVTTVLSLSGALSLPVLVFPVLSLVIPFMVRRLKNANLMMTCRCIWAIIHTAGRGGLYFLFFTRRLALMQTIGITKALLLFVVYFIVQVLIELCGLLGTKFFNLYSPLGYRSDEALDIIGYIIPIPFLYIGSILHIDLQDPMVYFYVCIINECKYIIC